MSWDVVGSLRVQPARVSAMEQTQRQLQPGRTTAQSRYSKDGWAQRRNGGMIPDMRQLFCPPAYATSAFKRSPHSAGLPMASVHTMTPDISIPFCT
jgi:hypothetical protein